jgi:tetratricopeptide (TPR) repeat protein
MSHSDEDEFLEKFRRPPGGARPEWALQPDASGSLKEAMESVPLFMSSTPSAEEISANPTLQAIQALLYDDTPDEIASNFKSQGNEAFFEKRFSYAVEFYTKGIEQTKASSALRSSLYSNRSAVCIHLGKWLDALNDCKRAINLDANNERAKERGIRCAIKLKDASFLEAHISHCSDEKLLQEAKTILLDSKSCEDTDKINEYLEKKFGLEYMECAEDEILVMLPSVDKGSLPIVKLQDGKSVFPVIVFYPEHSQCDFIEHFEEDDIFVDHISRLFESPPEWDVDRTYTLDNLELFAISQVDQQLHKLTGNMKLSDLFPKMVKRYERGIIAIFVLPRNNPSLLAEFTCRFSTK